MIRQKTITSKSIRILLGIGMFLFLCCLFTALTPLRAYAATGSDWSGENRYRVTVYWHVDNSYNVEDNFISLYYYDADTEISHYNQGQLNQVEDIYNGSREGHKTESIERTCDRKGNHTATVELPGAPLGLYYQIRGTGTNICRYYVDKIEVEVIDPVEGTGLPAKWTLWTGSIGGKNAHVGGATNYCRLWFDTKPPELTGWGNDSCTDKAKRTDSYDAAFCQYPYIAGITPLTVNGTVNVPTDDQAVSIEINAGILYDQLGAKWPLQKFEITCDQGEKNASIEHRDGKWYLVLQPDSNASEDYTVTISQDVYEGESHPVSTSVTVNTFDYSFTFVDENGTVLSRKSVDYGGQCTLPAVPSGCTARYECEEMDDWQDTTTGPKDRTVKVFYVTDQLPGSGTEEDPYLIRNSSDWECMRQNTEDGETGKFYRLEKDIRVTSVIGTEAQPFSGTFDGNGNTLDVSFSNDSNAVDAPFAYVRAASISNLTVTGSISGTGSYAAGLIGINMEDTESQNEKGTVITNCTVSADISGSSYVGGFAVGYDYANSVGADARLTIRQSSFKGNISANEIAGGFVALGTEKTYLSNCLFDPESAEASPGVPATFVGTQYGAILDCIYTETFGVSQGQASTDYKFVFRTSDGKKLEEQIVHEGEKPLVPVSDGNKKIASWRCSDCDNWTDTTNGILKRTVIATLSTESAFKGSGTASSPYEIFNADDWHSLKLRVQHFGTAGEFYRLECDLDVNEMIGTADKPFSGTFNGDMNTLHVTLSNEDDHERTAPFSYVKDAAFKYLRVTGSVTGSADRASGLIGENIGTTMINDCIVSADVSGDDLIGGFCAINKKDLTITDSTYNGKLNVTKGAGFVGFDTGNYGSESPDSAHFYRCLFDPQEGSSCVRGDPFAFASNANWTLSLYTAEWNDNDHYAPPRHGVPFERKYLDGVGSEEDPNLLYGHGAFGWEALRLITERESTEGIYFRQDSSLNAYAPVGDSEHAFEGHFDGNGNILKVCFEDKAGIEAPFSYVHNASIERATLMGTINGDRSAGLVGDCYGITRIAFCDILTDITGNSFAGGFVSMANGVLTIESCNFKGSINGKDSCGGFVASGTPNTKLTDCYFAPSGSSACMSGSTFVHMLHGDLVNCYYTVPFGTAQGTQYNHNNGSGRSGGGGSGGGASSAVVPHQDETPAADEEAKDEPVDLPFLDVPTKPGNWAYDSVKYVYEQKIMTGMRADYFGASETLSRAQFAAILFRIAGGPEVTSKQIFPDVPVTSDTEWYADAVTWASENSIIQGYQNGNFGPGDNITREQLAVMLYRYADFMNYDLSGKADLSAYPDADQVSDWAVDAMQWAVGNGIIKGDGEGNLNPKGLSDRAQCAAMVQRFMQTFMEA